MAQAWVNEVPAAARPLKVIPIALMRVMQQKIPVVAKLIDLDVSAVVTLPAAFTTAIEAAGGIDDYGVALLQQGSNPAVGRLFAEYADKTTTQFTITSDGSELTGKVLVLVFWTGA